MRLTIILLTLVFIGNPVNLSAQNKASDNVKLVILADMGNEPDEEQQMIHMLMCSNEFELAGLIAVTGWWLKSNPRPDLFHKLIDGYESVFPNLKLHDDEYPDPAYLRKIVKAGQQNYGIEDVGEGKSSEGSKLIETILLEEDNTIVYIVVNAGSNTLAQALFDLDTKLADSQMNDIIKKIRVYENGAQDNAGAWICNRYADIHWIRSNYQTYGYGGPRKNLGPVYWEPFGPTAKGQHQWLKQNVQTNHGKLGELYPDRYFDDLGYIAMEGGGTTPWIGLANKGLYDINNPHWGGWGGRFTQKKVADRFSKYNQFVRPDEIHHTPFYTYGEVSDTWQDPKTGAWYCNDYVPVWRWREAMYNDLKCRMDWCVRSFEEANHHPIAVVDSSFTDDILYFDVLPGQEVTLSASRSYDPDNDPISFNWWQYQEAGTYPGKILIQENNSDTLAFNVPTGASGKTLHMILEVTDQSEHGKLYDYRRLVFNVSQRKSLYLRRE